jgi:outer membrane protein assembly factor BamB
VRIEPWTFRFLRALALLGLAAAAPSPRASHFALPGDTFTDTRPLEVLKAAIEQRAYGDAAAQLDALLNEEGDKLMATQSPPGNRDGGLISVAAWVDTLAPAQRSALAAAYREKFDASIRSKVDVLAHDANARPEEFYSLARRHRFSATGAAAYALASDRVLERGDLCAASAMYQLALRGGWVPDDARAARIELLRRHVEEGKTLAPPPDESPPPAADGAPSSIPGAKASRLASAGVVFTAPLPFDAPWVVDGAATAGQPRFFPFAANGHIYQSGPRSILAFKETGQILWSAPSASGQGLPPTPRPLTDHVDSAMQPTTYAVAPLTDVYGRAQVLVVRQPVPPAGERDNDYCLRALRASDGKLLWSSELQPLLKDVSFASTPAVCGRFTYAIALATHASDAGAGGAGDRQVAMLLIALDTLSGELRWQATLGRFTLRVQDRDAWTALHQQPWDIAWHQSEPLAVGDAVYATPNSGFAAAVGRFDGKLRWLRPYPQAAGMDSPRPIRSREELRRAAQERGSVDPALGERWRGTPVLCGNVLIAAPQDTAQVFGFDAATGRLIWANGQVDIPPTLIGRTATTALFAGPGAVAAIEARDGGPSWRWEPPSGTRITGPAVARESEVLVPTSHSIVVVRSEDGVLVKEQTAATAPNLRRLMNGDALKRAIEEMGAAGAFGLQTSP